MPATAMGFVPVAFSRSRRTCMASASTGSSNPTFGSRIANWVVCTPTATPPAPASQ
jgi:hypothetical protein